jgi:HAMP domain-containing protein
VTDPSNPLSVAIEDDLFIFNVGFSPEGVEIDFLDPRRQAEGLNEITRLNIAKTLMPDEIEALEEAVRDLVDEALRSRRK